MKFSITWTLEKRKFAPLALTGDIGLCFETAKRLGFHGVELSLKSPADIAAGRVIKLMEQYNLEISAIATGLAFGEEGFCFCHEIETIRRQAGQRFMEHIDLAAKLNTSVILGLIRGAYSPDQAMREQQIEWTRESAAHCAAYAREAGVKILVEPINRYETRFINTLAEALGFMESVGGANLSLLGDLFHMNIEERNMEESLEKYREKLSYVHLVDSNRQFPGRGHLNLRSIIATLKKINYNGFLSMECVPAENPEKEALEAIQYVSEIMRAS